MEKGGKMLRGLKGKARMRGQKKASGGEPWEIRCWATYEDGKYSPKDPERDKEGRDEVGVP